MERLREKTCLRKILALASALFLTLAALPALTGQSAASDFIYIRTKADFLEFSANGQTNAYEGKTLVLCADLDMAGEAWKPLPEFKGVFNGNGHIVSGLAYSDTQNDAALLFFRLTDARVLNLRVDGSLTGGGVAAGFCRYLSGRSAIVNCLFSGTVSGGVRAAGIADEISDTAVLANVVFAGTVADRNLDPNNYAGAYGIAGYPSGANAFDKIHYAYATHDPLVNSRGDYGTPSGSALLTRGEMEAADFAARLNAGLAACANLAGGLTAEELIPWQAADGLPVFDADADRIDSPGEGSVISVSSGQELADLFAGSGGSDFKDKTIVLTQDISLWGVTNYQPLAVFSGTFDGNGCSISSFNVQNGFASDWAGLFITMQDGLVMNLRIDGAIIGGGVAAGICRKLLGDSVIINCMVQGSVRANNRTSGVADDMAATALVANTLCTADVTCGQQASQYYGAYGLVGYGDPDCNARVRYSFSVPDPALNTNGGYGVSPDSGVKSAQEMKTDAFVQQLNDNLIKGAALTDKVRLSQLVSWTVSAGQYPVFHPQKKPVAVSKYALQSLYDTLKGLHKGSYTDSTWNAFQTALAGAASVLESETAGQQAIDEAAALLEARHGALVAVDKTALKALVDANTGKTETDYTAGSWRGFAAALEKAEAALDNGDADTAQVDGALSELRDAADGLVCIAELRTLYNAQKDRERGGYTAGSWESFTAALEACKTALGSDNATAAQVNGARDGLRNALDALVDTAALKALYEAHRDKEKGVYTDTSWDAFEAALREAAAVLGNDNASREQADGAKAGLEQAVAGLTEKPVERDGLQTLYDQYKELEQGVYTDESWEDFTTALAGADAVLKNSAATQQQVDDAKTALETAVSGLRERPAPAPADKAALRALYDAVKNKAGDAFTGKSWTVFADALAAAKTLLDSGEAAQADVDAALTRLQKAADGLEEKAGEQTVNELKRLLAESGELEQGGAELSRWVSFQAALRQAEAVLADRDASQAAVRQALAALRAARQALAEDVDNPSTGAAAAAALPLAAVSAGAALLLSRKKAKARA